MLKNIEGSYFFVGTGMKKYFWGYVLFLFFCIDLGAAVEGDLMSQAFDCLAASVKLKPGAVLTQDTFSGAIFSLSTFLKQKYLMPKSCTDFPSFYQLEEGEVVIESPLVTAIKAYDEKVIEAMMVDPNQLYTGVYDVPVWVSRQGVESQKEMRTFQLTAPLLFHQIVWNDLGNLFIDKRYAEQKAECERRYPNINEQKEVSKGHFVMSYEDPQKALCLTKVEKEKESRTKIHPIGQKIGLHTLLVKGADSNQEVPIVYGRDQRTAPVLTVNPLLLALKHRCDDESVKLLIKKGANSLALIGGKSFFLFALEHQRYELAKYLYDNAFSEAQHNWQVEIGKFIDDSCGVELVEKSFSLLQKELFYPSFKEDARGASLLYRIVSCDSTEESIERGQLAVVRFLLTNCLFNLNEVVRGHSLLYTSVVCAQSPALYNLLERLGARPLDEERAEIARRLQQKPFKKEK